MLEILHGIVSTTLINYRRARLDIARSSEDILAALDQLGRKFLHLVPFKFHSRRGDDDDRVHLHRRRRRSIPVVLGCESFSRTGGEDWFPSEESGAPAISDIAICQ